MAREKVVKLQNRGVHCPTDSSLSGSNSNFKSSFGADEEDRSIRQIKNDVRAVIELMGPNTPHFDQSLSITDESAFQNTRTLSPKDKIDNENRDCLTENECSTLPTDVPAQDTDISLMVDDPTSCRQDHCICPPPMYPVNAGFNSDCMCPQMADFYHSMGVPKKAVSEKTSFFRSVYNLFKEKKYIGPKNSEYYKINMKQSSNRDFPKRLVFDLVEDSSNMHTQGLCDSGICSDCYLKKDSHHYPPLEQPVKQTDYAKERMFPIDNTRNITYKDQKFNQKTTYIDSNGYSRVDVYYFDHGCSNYFRTTDQSPILATDALAERTEAYTTKFWAELFGTFNIGFAFITTFVLQLLRFTLFTIVRPLTVGIFQLTSDYLFKPFLCTVFNALLQPIFIFFYNIVSSIRDFCHPVAEAVGYFLKELSWPIKAFRIVENRKEIPESAASKQDTRKDCKK